MRRIVIHRPGGHDRLAIEHHPDPRPGPGEVRIDVEAIGVNYADCVVRMGLYASANRFRGYPLTPGFEVAGRLGAVGEAVAAFEVGDAVVGVTLFDAYAEQLVLPAERVFRFPGGLSMAAAAGFPAVHLTAWWAMFELARPRPGDTILVHSAAGGVGSALVQLGRVVGCRVVGVVGAPHKRQPALDLGADEVVDKSRENLWEAAAELSPQGYQAVFDANGVATLRESYRHVAPAGKLVVYGFHSMLPRRGGRPSRLKLAWNWWRTPRFSPFKLTAENRSVLAFNLSFLGDQAPRLRQAMLELLEWLARGQIRPLPVTEYPFAEVARAHRDLESGQTVGKLVLVV